MNMSEFILIMAQENGLIFKMDYKEQTRKAMEMLAEDERVVFLGQTVCYPGSPM